MLREFGQIALVPPEVAAEERDQHAADVRDWYARHRQEEVARLLAWKAANPERVSEHNSTRRERECEGADGTLTREAIAQLKRKATECTYCGARLTAKQTDHMIPLALGGEHSLRNIVIVCPDCNARKATLSYEKWIERVGSQHRPRVAAIYLERYGQVAA
jgi:5-methylcytosine-specific restriction endonuclease McrA